MGWDPTLIRLAWVLLIVIFQWPPLVAYALCALCFSKEKA